MSSDATTSHAEQLFACYVERLVLEGVRLAADELAAGDRELGAAVRQRIEAFHAIDEALAHPSPFVGSTVGAYRILASLGSGGMGEVYRARDSRLGREVALKVLPPLFALDPGRHARFEREARLLAALHHPCVEAIYGIETLENRTFLVLELVEGETLATCLGRGPLEVPTALRLLGEVAAGLEAAHAKGILHRDLKPANVQITPDAHAKVLDFSLGKECGAEGLGKVPATRGGRFAPTITGMILGTASYMSPEQARGRDVDERTDVWSFGCVLYEALTGRRAFPGATFTDAVACVFHREPDWRALPPATPVTIRRLLRRCLEKDREQRLASILEARATIEQALVGAPRRRHGEWRATAVAAVAVLGALASLPRRDRPMGPRAVAAMPSAQLSSPRPPHFDAPAYRSYLASVYARWREGYDSRSGSEPRSPLVYLAVSEPAAVEVFSATSNAIVARIPLPVRDPRDLVTALDLTPDGSRLYAIAGSETDRLFVIDTRSKTLLELPDGQGLPVEDEPSALVLTPDGGRAYVAHASGYVTVIDTDPGSPTYHRRLAVPEGPALRLPGKLRGLALSPDGNRLYVASEGPDTVSVIDTDPRSPTFHRRLRVPDGEAIRAGRGPQRLMGFHPGGNQLYITNSLSDDVALVDTQRGSPSFHTVVATVAAPLTPISAGVTPDGSLAYVVCQHSGTVETLDTASVAMVFEPIEVGVTPLWIAFTPDGTRGFVPNTNSRTVSVIDTDPRSPAFRTVVATIPTRGRPMGVVVGRDSAPGRRPGASP